MRACARERLEVFTKPEQYKRLKDPRQRVVLEGTINWRNNQLKKQSTDGRISFNPGVVAVNGVCQSIKTTSGSSRKRRQLQFMGDLLAESEGRGLYRAQTLMTFPDGKRLIWTVNKKYEKSRKMGNRWSGLSMNTENEKRTFKAERVWRIEGTWNDTCLRRRWQTLNTRNKKNLVGGHAVYICVLLIASWRIYIIYIYIYAFCW